ncbi:MAG: hypothetical protein H7317_06745 [Pseudorhodobacter sp.]|nr:hypothetical protein [Pseudorhodobacter sp.]
MSIDKDSAGPERDTASAFSYPVTRDFDGGLLRRWTFMLTYRDALAVLRLKRRLSRRARIALGLACFAGGAIWALMPWGAPFLVTEAVLLGLPYLGRDLWQRITAYRLIPLPRPGMLEEWTDCMAGSEITSRDEAYLSPELIGEVLLTRTHLFLRSGDTTIVVPRSAIADEAEELAAYITQLSRGPYYFEAPLDDARDAH